MRRSLWLLFGAVALVLLAACGNVACLLLADAARREHEIAVRLALGSGRGTVVRQLCLEGLVLACCGAALGLLVAHQGLRLLRDAAPQLPRLRDVTVDGRIIAFTMTLAVLTTVLFSLAPALHATRVDLVRRLARGGRSVARRTPRASAGAGRGAGHARGRAPHRRRPRRAELRSSSARVSGLLAVERAGLPDQRAME